jgi:HAD superfamily hydrolase (TIGR01484 family)
MYELIVFDLDNTLAPSKMVIDEEISSALKKLLQKKKVAVISGGSFKQFEKELLFNLPLDCKFENLHIFPTDGASYYAWITDEGRWQIIYQEVLADKDKIKILDAFGKVLKELHFDETVQVGKLIEDRISAMTFSGLGQDAELPAKQKWDPDHTRRTEIRNHLIPLLPEFEISIAGTTSIDITKKGLDKAYGIGKMIEYIKVPIEKMVFIGDSLFPGGNDSAVKKTGITTISVSGPEETKKIIRDLL